jgi:hypothetical protein
LEESTVITLAATKITENSATLNGKVFKNDEHITERGFEWRKIEDTAWRVIWDLQGIENISVPLSSLTKNASYGFRAYIKTNTNIKKYGSILTFTATDNTNVPNYLSKSDIILYPNPTTGKITITYEDKGACTLVKVYDVVGQVVFTSAVSSPPSEGLGELVIDVSHLANGMYFLKINNKIFKIIKYNE